MTDLYKLAESATLALQLEPGFVNCEVFGDPPSGLAFQFEAFLDAEQFKFKRELEDVVFPLEIQGSVVFEYRSMNNI